MFKIKPRYKVFAGRIVYKSDVIGRKAEHYLLRSNSRNEMFTGCELDT